MAKPSFAITVHHSDVYLNDHFMLITASLSLSKAEKFQAPATQHYFSTDIRQQVDVSVNCQTYSAMSKHEHSLVTGQYSLIFKYLPG